MANLKQTVIKHATGQANIKKQAATKLNVTGQLSDNQIKVYSIEDFLKNIRTDVYDYNITKIEKAGINYDIIAEPDEMGYQFDIVINNIELVISCDIELENGDVVSEYDLEIPINLTEFKINFDFNQSTQIFLKLLDVEIDYQAKEIKLLFLK